MSKKTFIKGAFILTLAGIITRILGFFFKIYLSRVIGATGVGLYQLVMPVNAIGYALGIAGFEVAISRLTASYCAKKKEGTALGITLLTLTYSLIICTTCCIIVTKNSTFIADKIFDNPHCAPLIKMVILSLPFSCIHCMITSYCLGKEKTIFPALSQLAEQLIRIGSIYFVIKITGKTDAATGAICLVIGEIGAAIISVSYIIFAKKKHKLPSVKDLPLYSKEIFATYLPVSGNRVILYGLQSIEILIIPGMLVKSGLSYNDALGTFGVITGMAIPLILFPATLSNSVALMLLPSVSKIKDNPKKLHESGNSALTFSIVFGFICIVFFLVAGAKIGALCFNEPQIKTYINVLAWLCPFIFISTTFKSILNALGKSSRVFANNMLSEIVTIIFIVICIPKFGIKAYMYGLLISQVTNAMLQLSGYHYHMKSLTTKNQPR